MNEGYLSYILLLVTVILLGSGWQRSLARDIPIRQLVLFIMIWITGLIFALPINEEIYVQASSAALLLVLIAWLRSTTMASLIYILTASLLTGLISHMMLVLYRLDPVLLIFEPRIDRALIVGLFAWMISRRLLQQAAVITIASWLGETATHLTDSWRIYPLLLGGPDFQDLWWIALYTAKILTIVSDSLAHLTAAISRKLPWWTRVSRK